jgi:hypothetical protein
LKIILVIRKLTGSFAEKKAIMSLRFSLCLTLFFLIATPPLRGEGPPWKFSTDEGKRSATIGFLAQPQFEALTKADGTGTANSLFLRRFRLIAGGKISPKLSYFVESDAANLGKLGTNGKRTSDFYLQDAFLTYAFRPEIQLDAGMLMVAVSHNSGQSAASLMSVDYGAYSFLASDPTHGKFGRDYGVQVRGYIKKHFEYRLGGFRGHHIPNPRFPHRYTARFVWYPFEPDTGFFYTGTTLAKKRIVAIGGGIDRQNDYGTSSVDFFVDQPLGGGSSITLQADFIHYNGGTTFASLPHQSTWLLEGGYYLHRAKLGPYVQLSTRDFANPRLADDKKFSGGLAYWLSGHKLNIKMGIGRLLKDGAPDRTQFVLQTQFFYY